MPTFSVTCVPKIIVIEPCTSRLQQVKGGTFYETRCTFSGALAPDGILPRAKFTLRPSLAFSYIGSVTARHSSSWLSQTLRRGTSVMGGYSHLVPAGTFRVSVLVGFVCPCIMLCLWRVLLRLAARRYLSCCGARPRNVT